MNILFIHNSYQNHGGEDLSFINEFTNIQARQRADSWVVSNLGINSKNYLYTAFNSLWSPKHKRILDEKLIGAHFEITHFHNTFPLLSPSVYYGAHNRDVAVIQTLHNYRLLCPSALFLRGNQTCESCKGKFFAFPGVIHKCYRNSFAATFVTALMLSFHKLIGTWQKQVDVYIALTEFSRNKFIEGGLPPEKIVVKPNFIDPDPGMKTLEGKYALFVGRLSPEKGFHTLLNAWSEIIEVPLLIGGEGPLGQEAQKAPNSLVHFLGHLDHSEVISKMKSARFLVIPSECYENFPLVLVEAYACGLPVITSRLGAMAELVKDGITGLLFEPGNATDLAEKVRWAWSHPAELAEMGSHARAEYEAKYTSEKNYEQLMTIYQLAIERNQARVNAKNRKGFFSRFQAHQN